MTLQHRFNAFCNQYIQFVYVMMIPSWRYLWAAKIGISNEPIRRRNEVQYSIKKETGHKIIVVCIYFPFIGFASWERIFLKFGMWFYGTREVPGSGRTEWRMIRNWAIGLIFAYFGKPLYGNMLEIWRFLLIVFLPLPLDLIVLVAFAFFLEFAVFSGICYGLYFIIFSLIHFF